MKPYTTPITTRRTHWLELKIPPLLLLALCATVIALLPASWHATALWPLRYTGVLLIGIGAAVCAAGVLAFARQRTTVDPRAPQRSTALVTSGIYRYSRNPMYLGFAVLLLGWCGLHLQPWGLATATAFVLYVQRYQIHPEEAILRERFGQTYLRYCQQVRRWL